MLFEPMDEAPAPTPPRKPLLGRIREHLTIRNLFLTQVIGCAAFFLVFAASTMSTTKNQYGETVVNNIIFGLLVIINSLFSCYYAIVSVLKENKYQLACYVVTTLTLLLRGLLMATRGELSPGQILLLVVGGILVVTTMIMTIPVQRSFGWNIFRKSGAIKHMKDMYLQYERFLAFVRLDIQYLSMVFVLFSMCMKVTLPLLCSLVLVSFASDGIIQWAVQHEKARLVYAWFIFKLMVPSWWIYNLTRYLRCYDDWVAWKEEHGEEVPFASYHTNNSVTITVSEWTPPRYHDNCLQSNVEQQKWVLEAYLLIVIQALLVRVLLYISTVVVLRNFGRGLKEQVFKKGRENIKEVMEVQFIGDDDMAQDPNAGNSANGTCIE